MSSSTYIIAWDKALENCLEMDRQLSASGLRYKFFNVSSDKTPRSNWVESEDVRYYGHFYNALKDFLTSSSQVFGFNAGDPEYSDYPHIIKKAELLLKDSPGIYAPNMAGDFLSEEGVYLQKSKKYPGLYLATQTNGMCVFMDWNAASMTFDFMSWMINSKNIDLSSMKSGWGLDTAYCLMAMYTNIPIYRDSEIYINHPPGSIYSGSQAGKEMKIIDDMFIEYATSARSWDGELLKSMRSEIFTKARKRTSYELRLNSVYPNLKGDLED